MFDGKFSIDKVQEGLKGLSNLVDTSESEYLKFKKISETMEHDVSGLFDAYKIDAPPTANNIINSLIALKSDYAKAFSDVLDQSECNCFEGSDFTGLISSAVKAKEFVEDKKEEKEEEKAKEEAGTETEVKKILGLPRPVFGGIIIIVILLIILSILNKSNAKG